MSRSRPAARSVRRWLGGTSNRTFVVWPLLLLAVQSLIEGGWPAINPWGLPLLAWGWAQYRWVGRFRAAHGGGGPGVSNPPVNLVTSGPYAWTRNPMYLGHLIFLAGLAVLLSGPAWLVLAAHVLWFERRVREDEARLASLFGQPYRDYQQRVKRWIPAVY